MSTTDTTDLAARTNPGESLPARLPPWAIFAAGFIGGIIVVYGGVTRPLSNDLARLDRQVAGLSRGIGQLAGQTGQAAKSTELLALLARQGQEAEAASEALARIQALQKQLLDEQPAMSEALDQLVAEWSLVADRLVGAAGRTEEARRASDELLALQGGILCGSDAPGLQSASQALDELVMLRGRLQDQASDLESASTRLDGLLGLKDQVIGRTGDLAEAIEALETSADVQQQFVAASQSFDAMRRWMAEMVLLEPTFQRLVDLLKPLSELTNLRRLSPDELRHAARAIAERRATRPAQPSVPPQSGSGPSTGGSVQVGKAAGSHFLLDSIDFE